MSGTQVTPSIVRTAVPIAVAQLVAWAAGHGLDLGPWQGLAEQALGALAGIAYYAAVRFLEVKVKPRWGWLLGYGTPPTYDATAKKDASSPSGESAADGSLLPTDTPVETVPVVDVPQSSDTKSDAAYHGSTAYVPRHQAPVGNGTPNDGSTGGCE